MQIRNWLSKWLTRVYARTIDLSGVAKEETYRAHGEERRVFWVDADGWPVAGQLTLFGTVLLNESRLDDVPKEVVDYTFLHEIGHSKLPTILSIGSVLARIPLSFVAIFGIPALIVQWLVFLFSGPTIGQFTTLSVAYLLVALLILVPLVAIWRLDEGYAEFYVVSKVGEETYLRYFEKMEANSDRGVFARIFRKIFYPSPKHVLWVANSRWT
jgi:hypothetical protein